jgi:hypothetical protein
MAIRLMKTANLYINIFYLSFLYIILGSTMQETNYMYVDMACAFHKIWNEKIMYISVYTNDTINGFSLFVEGSVCPFRTKKKCL